MLGDMQHKLFTNALYASFCLCLCVLFFSSANALALEDSGESLVLPSNKGSWWLNLRSRLERVQQEISSRAATASILRTRLGYKTRNFEGFSALFEVEDRRVLGDSHYSTGDALQPMLARPVGSAINRAYVSYAGMLDTAFTYGRQRLSLDTARAIDDSGWAQQEQSFDAFKVENTSFTDTKITLAYVDKAHGVFGADNDNDNGAVRMQSPLINVEYKGSPMLDVSGYGYFLSFDNDTASSRQTSGVRVKGEYPLIGIALLYAAEYARQSDYKDGMADINADYRHLIAGFRFAAVTAEFGFEALSGDGAYAFQTPLATGQAFNGWADQFLVTPLNGLKDVYVSADMSFAGMRWKAVFHDFSAERGGVDYGNEVNLLIVKNFSSRYTLGLKYANYSANDFSVDTEKIQIYAEINI